MLWDGGVHLKFYFKNNKTFFFRMKLNEDVSKDLLLF